MQLTAENELATSHAARGLVKSAAPVIPSRATEASFTWKMRPADDRYCGSISPDGSMLDGPDKLTARCGWAFVVKDHRSGQTLASAYGITPHWIVDIAGARCGR